MRRIISSILIASVLLFIGTSFGLATFGAHAEHQEMGDCAGSAHCMPTTPDAQGQAAADGVNCMNQCLGAASVPLLPAIPPTVAFLLAFIVALVAAMTTAASVSTAIAERWREGIGKAVLHQRLSTVMLRN